MASKKVVEAFAKLIHYDAVEIDITDNDVSFKYISVIKDMVCDCILTDNTVKIGIDDNEWKEKVSKEFQQFGIDIDLLNGKGKEDAMLELNVISKVRDYISNVQIPKCDVTLVDDVITITQNIDNKDEIYNTLCNCIEYTDRFIINMFILVNPDELERKIDRLIEQGISDDELYDNYNPDEEITNNSMMNMFNQIADCTLRDSAIYKHLMAKWDEQVVLYPGIYEDTGEVCITQLLVGDYLFYHGNNFVYNVDANTKLYGYKCYENSNPKEIIKSSIFKIINYESRLMIGKNWINAIKYYNRLQLSENITLEVDDRGYVQAETTGNNLIVNEIGAESYCMSNALIIGRVVGNQFIPFMIDKELTNDFRHYTILSELDF